MLNYKYTDILIADLGSVRSSIAETGQVKKNIADTRCIVSWSGDNPQFVTDLGCTVRNHSEALSYYRDPVNGWIEDPTNGW